MAHDPLHLLCVEPRFPGRLGAIADWLVRRRGYRGWFFCHTADAQPHWPESVGKGLEVVQFQVGGVAREAAVPWTRYLERGLCYAYACWEALEARRPRPVDVILGRSAGLGSTLFVPVHFPHVPVINLFDYFFHAHCNDLADEAGPNMPPSYYHWRRAANGMDYLDLEGGALPWTLSAWQRDLFPVEYRPDFTVFSDGVDVRRFARPIKPAGPRTIAGRSLPGEARLVTFVATSVDRLRGFDRFYGLANRLLQVRPDVICAVVGNPVVQRGLDVQFFNHDYRAQLLAQTPPHAPDRLWFLNTLRQSELAEVLAASDLHVYASRPYPVSRSLVEAMAAGCIVLAADTPPVRELVRHGQTGLLVPPADADAWEKQALVVLADLAAHRPLGDAAARLVREQYSRDVTLPKLAAWFDRLASGRCPPPTSGATHEPDRGGKTPA
jgi:glycosyltransferase involved in cell wall biosynthesis